MTDLPEHLLVLRCQTGDSDAFRRLYDAYGNRSLRYLRGLLGSDADDVQQEVWLSVYRRIGSLANPGGFRTWLFATTRNRALDHLRRRRRQAELIAPAEPDVQTATEDDEPGFDPGHLETALQSLQPVHREVLLLRYWDDLSYGEIALVVGCSLGTVRSRLHNAKRNLMNVLSDNSTAATATGE
jgi:RNA polymerase sigma-70 factor (ECF subfamily)